MVYNFNLGIGWASSGVEYAQSYRAGVLRKIGIDAKFVFTDMFSRDNIAEMTENIGFLDSEVIWLYTYFSDFKVAPVSYTVEQLKKSLGGRKYTERIDGSTIVLDFEGTGNFYRVYLTKEGSNLVHRVEIVENNRLIRKDYFTYGRIFSEYYAPFDGKAKLYQRRFFNENGTTCYEMIIDGDSEFYKFPDELICTKEDFIGYMVRSLKLTSDDIVIIDRVTGIGQAILENMGDAKLGVVVHADHFSEGATDDDNILWNNYYEYQFKYYEYVDFYITATDAQNQLIREQFRKYVGAEPNVLTIPVGSIDELKYPSTDGRKLHSLITASRLASEKHVDWIINAVAMAKEAVPDITLDIYGKGGEEKKLGELIKEHNASDYIFLKGHHNLSEIYQNYEAYISGSTSEGFGLTLLEAIGAGLPIVGFDVRYGNQTFIIEGKNGYKLKIDDSMDGKTKTKLLADALVKLFTEDDLEEMHKVSYERAKEFLTTEVEKKWKEVLS